MNKNNLINKINKRKLFNKKNKTLLLKILINKVLDILIYKVLHLINNKIILNLIYIIQFKLIIKNNHIEVKEILIRKEYRVYVILNSLQKEIIYFKIKKMIR